jgi:hypothetical protein
VVESGTHEELVRAGGARAELHELQARAHRGAGAARGRPRPARGYVFLTTISVPFMNGCTVQM